MVKGIRCKNNLVSFVCGSDSCTPCFLKIKVRQSVVDKIHFDFMSIEELFIFKVELFGVCNKGLEAMIFKKPFEKLKLRIKVLFMRKVIHNEDCPKVSFPSMKFPFFQEHFKKKSSRCLNPFQCQHSIFFVLLLTRDLRGHHRH